MIPSEKIIDPRELRIGNYLLYEGKIVAVTVLSVNPKDFSKGVIAFNEIGKTDSQIGGNIDGFGNKLERIPITGEILERFGFLKYSCGGNGRYNISDYIIEPTDRNPQRGYSILQIHDDGVLEIAQFKYVHQLQNFYYSVTDEELKFKP